MRPNRPRFHPTGCHNQTHYPQVGLMPPKQGPWLISVGSGRTSRHTVPASGSRQRTNCRRIPVRLPAPGRIVNLASRPGRSLARGDHRRISAGNSSAVSKSGARRSADGMFNFPVNGHGRYETGRLTGLKGRHRKAQGTALGGVKPLDSSVLKGRNRRAQGNALGWLCHPFRCNDESQGRRV